MPLAKQLRVMAVAHDLQNEIHPPSGCLTRRQRQGHGSRIAQDELPNS